MAKALSGIQPTGEITMGNYIGAVRNWKNDPGNLFVVVDLHSLSQPWDPKELEENTLGTASLLLALGLGDPSRVFVQSHVPEHAEFAWILNCLGRMGELGRMTQYKSKGRGRDDVSVGLFTYPLLMAADILLYNVREVPVGEDQKQHIELTRDIAERFNKRFGPVLTVPEPKIQEVGARIASLRNPAEKMSKSDPDRNSKILLTDSDDEMRKKIMTAVTDSGSEVIYDPEQKPGVSNLLEIASTLSGESVEEIAARHRTSGYGAFKRSVADVVVGTLGPIRERVSAVRSDSAGVDRALLEGREHARLEAGTMLRNVKQAIGLRLPTV